MDKKLMILTTGMCAVFVGIACLTKTLEEPIPIQAKEEACEVITCELDHAGDGINVLVAEVEKQKLEVVTQPVRETSSTEVTEEKEPESIGKFKLTAYCVCKKCCGKWAEYGLTSSGTVPKQGRTVAADKSVLPAGTKILINGHEYIVEDTGVKGKHIDVFFESHQDALEFGVKYAEVFLKGE